MRVFVINMRGEPLMPCSQRKARILLKQGKAKIYSYNPFTIQLLYPTGEAKQECNIGVDTGSKHIGIAITSETKVLWKAEIELRQNVKSNINTKRIYRRSRRNRKTRYREARWKNRRKSKGWLPPSIEIKVQNQLKDYGINFITQKFWKQPDNTKYFFSDIYIEDFNLVIECNGDYWHNLDYKKNRDDKLQETLDTLGVNLVWIWEHDINKEDFDVMNYIKDYLKV